MALITAEASSILLKFNYEHAQTVSAAPTTTFLARVLHHHTRPQQRYSNS